MYVPAYVNLAANFILRFSVDSILRRESNPSLARQTFRHETRFIIKRERKKKEKKKTTNYSYRRVIEEPVS